jgi:hypothetical protein
VATSVSADRKRRSRTPALLFFLACFIGVIVWAPAAWLLPALPASIACVETAGSVWQGECRGLQRVDSFGSRAELGQLRWRISAWSLFTLSPSAELVWQLGDANARAEVKRALNTTWQVRDLRFASDYRSLGPLVDSDLRRLWRGMPSTEGVTLTIPLASGNTKEIQQLQGELRFFAFGKHVLAINPDGSGELRSDDGALRLSGPLEWQRDGRYRLKLKIRLGGTADAALRAALRSFGPVNPSGEYDLTIEGSIWTLLR